MGDPLRLRDSAAGEQVCSPARPLGDGEFVARRLDGQRVIRISSEAWRHLGWLVPDPTGVLTRYPGEVFGPLPEYRG
jgi:hypothetical protein